MTRFVLTNSAMVTAIDEGIGEVVDALKARDMWENTLLVFSSGKTCINVARNVR